MLIRNPRKPEQTVETSLSEAQAAEICAKLNNDFARSLASFLKKDGSLSPARYFWLFKMAEENNDTSAPCVELLSDLQEWCSKTPLMQFRFEDLGKVFLHTKTDKIVVTLGFRYVGAIEGSKFLPAKNCPTKIIAELKIMSANPQGWMQNYGIATGHCCVCGLLLTNEESVKFGIGPICRAKWGM